MTPTASFTDGKGRQWDLRVTAAHAVDLKAAGININKALTDHTWIGALVEDVALLVAALHIVANPQSKGVTPEDFNEALDGSTLEAAADALALAIVGFFPRSKIAGAMQAKLKTLLSRATEEAAKKIEAVDIETLIASASAGNSAGSSASTPAPSPSAS